MDSELTMLKRLFLVACACIVPLLANAAAPTVDTQNSNGQGSVSTSTVSLTTTQTNDIVVLFATAWASTSLTPPTVSSVSGASLTWNCLFGALGSCTKSGNSTQSATSGCQLGGNACSIDAEVWWALAASTVSAQTISIAWSAATNGADTVISSWHGVFNTSAPWDSNAALPAVAKFNAAASPTITGFSTSSTDDALITLNATGASAGIWFECDSGWTQNCGSRASNWVEPSCTSKGVTALQSNLTLDFKQTGASCPQSMSGGPWIFFSHALAGTAPAAPTRGSGWTIMK